MKFPTARCLLLAFALSGSAFAQAAIEVPVIPPPVELAVDPAAESENEEMEETVTIPSPVAVGIDTPRLYEFQGDEIGLVIRTLARQGGMNVALSDSALKSGTVTMRIENKSPREALEVIVQLKGLLKDEFGGINFIKTAAEVAQEPIPNALGRLTDTVVGPLAKMKGTYYRQLVESGLPETTASAIVLNEDLSHTTFAGRTSAFAPAPSAGNNASEVSEWVAWTVLGSAGINILLWAPLLTLHFILAIAVWATARRNQHSGLELLYFSPFFWGIATLIGGVFVAGLYWVMHHSSLRPAGSIAG